MREGHEHHDTFTTFTLRRRRQKFIRRMLRFDGGAGQRLSAGGEPRRLLGACGGYQRRSRAAPGDAVVERDGIRFFLPAESRLLLDGVTIDFADTATHQRLRLPRPKRRQLRMQRH